MKHIHFPLILLTIMLACNLFTACNDDEGGGIPVIHHIRLTDPEKADSTFTDVNPGTMIVAIGENLNGVKKVFINQQEVSFNSNYSTSTNLILTIPADLPLVGANPDLKDELRIETTHGTAIYSMHVLSPAPYITRIATTFPVEVGTPLRVIGGNFYEIQRIYFTTAEGDITDAPVSTEITEFTVNKDFSEISFKAPAGLIDEGSLVVECYTAAAFTPFRRTALPPSINKVSSMMPITGTTVTVLGQNFMDIASLTMGNRSVDSPSPQWAALPKFRASILWRISCSTTMTSVPSHGADLPQPSQPTVRYPPTSPTGNAISWPVNFLHGTGGGDNCRTPLYGILMPPSCLPLHRLPN